MMNRREALRLLAAGAALPLAPARVLAAMREARAVLGTKPGAAPRTLNAHQDATVTAMAEMILPRTETPGATDVGVAEFIDLMLTEWYDEPERARFLQGLADVDQHAQTLFAKDFVDCAAPQQGEVLTALGEQMVEEERRLRERDLVRYSSSETAEAFYPMLRRLTLTAYYTSEAGATEALHFEIIPSSHDGCVQIKAAGVPERE
jgi:glucoside 3-dehydrogenase (cytochrome c) hitch-hiker subunit